MAHGLGGVRDAPAGGVARRSLEAGPLRQAASTASALPMALPATSSRSPAVISSIPSAERRWSDGRSRRSRSTPSTRTSSASGRRRSSLPASPQGIRTQWCHGAPGMVASLATMAPDDERLTELLARRRRAHLARRPAPEGRPALPWHRRQRVRVSEAVRAHRRRALARARTRIRDALGRAGRGRSGGARPRPPHALDRRSRHGRLPAELPQRQRRRCRRSTTSRA